MPILSLFILFGLLVLYGLAWHDKPAQPAVIRHHDHRKQPPEDNATREKLREEPSSLH